ncbi:hypothetical protein AMAG_20748 [Allomyces macrogynus ATCC 38327]|uniref:DUF985 domain-containing protein n=1 Tax=Allomyces macrogynus (strain ATCC 38327) TaxID=578462 RepID=A0A0L0TF69_ALLM3|nr:hypothetical protein AMAG_20748 [Allomyces macrogynus ATCC 38327]|eukprot:KNE73350.1 hypothetical protein AMAG_20748 [Allomyces macrogynus ATCC 38327]
MALPSPSPSPSPGTAPPSLLLTAAQLISLHGMAPYPKGGYYVETFRSAHSMAILYLLPAGHASALHKLLPSTAAAVLFEYDEVACEATRTVLGADAAVGEKVQYVFCAGKWFGANFAEFALASRELSQELMVKLPEYQADLVHLGRPDPSLVPREDKVENAE